MKTLVALLTLLLLSSCSPPKDKILLSGKLLGYDGSSLVYSTIKIRGNNFSERKYLDSSGEFLFELSSPGGYYLNAGGVHHNNVFFPIVITNEEKLEIEIKLPIQNYHSHHDSLFVIGDFNNFSEDSGLKSLNNVSDGLYTIELDNELDTLSYKILGASEDEHSIAGTQASYYMRDTNYAFRGGQTGNFVSVLKSVDGKVRINFDYSKLSDKEYDLDINFNDSTNTRLFEVYTKIEEKRKIYNDSIKSYRFAGKDMKYFKYDWSNSLREIKELYTNEKNRVIKDYLLLQYCWYSQSQSDSLMARQIISGISADSYAYSLMWDPANMFYKIFTLSKDTQSSERYFRTVVDNNLDTNVKASALFTLLGKKYEVNKKVESKQLYYELINNYGNTFFADIAKRRYSPDSEIETGKNIPEFSFISFDDSTSLITNKTLLGKIYLIDFWATWCGPCIGEMDNLHKIYKKYGSSNFTILSISSDSDKSIVETFRNEKWAMPWLNVHITGDLKKEVSEKFEVAGIPKPILVNESGEIIAVENELRGEQLELTLAKYIKN